MKCIKKLVVCSIFALAVALPKLSFAQLDPGCSPDDPCPIDSDVYVLIAAVLMFAGMALYRQLKRAQQLN
jgi:hypothetical protein